MPSLQLPWCRHCNPPERPKTPSSFAEAVWVPRLCEHFLFSSHPLSVLQQSRLCHLIHILHTSGQTHGASPVQRRRGGGSYVVLGMLVLLLVFARQHNNFNFQTRDMVQNRFVVQWYYALRFHGTNCSSMASICCGSNGRAVVQWYCATAKMSQWVS